MIQKISTCQWDHYTTGYLLDYLNEYCIIGYLFQRIL